MTSEVTGSRPFLTAEPARHRAFPDPSPIPPPTLVGMPEGPREGPHRLRTKTTLAWVISGLGGAIAEPPSGPVDPGRR